MDDSGEGEVWLGHSEDAGPGPQVGFLHCSQTKFILSPALGVESKARLSSSSKTSNLVAQFQMAYSQLKVG